MVNITTAMAESKIFQKIGFDMYFDAARAPNPIVENQAKLATEAPTAKNQRS